MTTTALVLAAGSSRRLGRPKQLLPFGSGTLLDATLRTVRRCGFDQVLVTLGGAADEIERVVDLRGVTVVRNPDHGDGCSSSIAAALPRVESASEGFVLLLGDQPLVSPDAVAALLDLGRPDVLATCRYDDGIGHPFWLGRALFARLATLHGDKGVWKLVDAAGDSLVTARLSGPIPRDVDTWADYEALCAEVGLEVAQ